MTIRSRWMFHIILLICLTVLFDGPLKAQTFWSEDFGTNNCFNGSDLVPNFSSENGQWEMTETGFNDDQSNVWYVSPQEVGGFEWGECGESCNDIFLNYNNTLHLSTDPLGDLGANYLETGAEFTTSDVRAETPVVDCSGKNNISVKFDYLAGGIPGSDQCFVEYYNGSSWETLGLLDTTGTCGNKGIWSYACFALPGSANNNPAVKVGFRWQNQDEGVAADPSVAIDNIEFAENLDCGTVNVSVSGLNAIKVYPNPARNVIRVLAPIGEYTFELVNDLGQKIEVETHGGGGSREIIIQHVQPGLYFLRISDRLHSRFEKIVIE